MSRKVVSLFLRKSIPGIHYSIENYYSELIKYNNKKFTFKINKCPFESKGIFKRILLIFWAAFKQGDINHISGDISFISFFFNKKKTITTILDNYSLFRLKGIKKKIYYFFWIKIPIKKSVKIIAISNKTKNEIIRYCKVKKNKIAVIDVCISSFFKKKIKKKIIKKPKILIVGTGENKNIKNILLALNKINCELIIVGKLSYENISIINKFKIPLKNYVSISNKSILQKYYESDILVFASKYEGFGMPILEAQAVGRAVVTSQLEPMTYVAGQGAYYVNPYSIKSINNGIKIIINNDKLRNNLINKGFINVKRFNKLKILESLYNCYNEVLKGNT